MNIKASRKLFDEVIDANLCCLCGGCCGGCPYLISHNGRIAVMNNCIIDEGQCYQYCPRTYVDMDEISQQYFGVPYTSDGIGTNKEVLIAQSTDALIREKAQYGGTVTTLLLEALEEGIIDGAILTRMSADKTPSAFLARNKQEVIQSAGSNYMACPVLEVLNRIPKESKDRLGIVVTPCQALALAKMKKDPPRDRVNINNVELVIGLFCTWAFCPKEFSEFLKNNIDLPQVTKFDIPPPPANRFDAYVGANKVSLPLDQIREFIMPACSYCLDMTAEFADVSVGSAEGIEGWNTLIVRTEGGSELVKLAKAKRKLETNTLPLQNLSHLREAALIKKKWLSKEILNNENTLLQLAFLPWFI